MTKKNVPAAELEILACLQKLGHATAREIREDLRAFRPMTHGAILNLLKRLESKRLVTRRKAPVGKAFIYQATEKVDSVYSRMLGRLVNRIYAGDIIAVVSSLFETKPPNLEQLDRLEQMVNELREKQAKKGKS